MTRSEKKLQKGIEEAEQVALEMLVDLFDWLDGLEPQPTTEIVDLYKKSQIIESKITDTLPQMDQAAKQMAAIGKLMKELQKKSSVSCFYPLAPGSQILCSLDIGHGKVFQIPKYHNCAGLEAAARLHSQLPLHHAGLLFHLRRETFRCWGFFTFSVAIVIMLRVQPPPLVSFPLVLHVGASV